VKFYFQKKWNEWPPEGGRFFWPQSAFAQQVQQFVSDWESGQTSFEIKTSGSTGKPKTISLNRKLMEASAKATMQAFEFGKINSVWLAISPMHIGGLMVLVRACLANQDVIFSEPTNQLSTEIQAGLPLSHFTSLVPSQLHHLLSDEKSIRYLNQMKGILVGGGPVSPALQYLIASSLKVPVYQTFGMTETISHVAYRTLNAVDSLNLPYVGLPGYQFAVSDTGSLLVKGGVTEHNWLETNDLIDLNSDTSFFWLGRKDRVVISGGKKIYPELLEQRLRQILPNCNFFFAGLPHTSWGQSLALFIEGEKNAAWNENINSTLEGSERPKSISYLPQFVYTPTGKINQSETMALINVTHENNA